VNRVVEVPYRRGRTVVVTYDVDAFLHAAEAVPFVFVNGRPSRVNLHKDAAATMLSKAIVEWDLHRDGRACPTDPEFLSSLPTRILFVVARAITYDAMEAAGDPRRN
jgi:hypothetical protein